MIHLALRTAHSDSKWLKLAGNKFSQSDFTSFDKKVSANLHYFRFLHCLGYISIFVKLLQLQL